MKPNDKPYTIKESGFDSFLSRENEKSPNLADFIGGAEFDAKLDEILFNRMIKLKDLRQAPQGNEQGKIYWDGDSGKFKIWVGASGGWADVTFTSTSTSTTSTSSSSTSTTSTSSSTSTTSTSSSSTSTTSTSTS